MLSLGDYLARCPRCHQTCLLVYGEASYRNLALFEATPWSPLDEAEPQHDLDNGAWRMTDHALQQWRNQLPYKLAISYLDFDRGTWQLAMVRANEKLRAGMSLWRPHTCPLEASDGVEPTKKDLVPDLPVLARDRGVERGAVAAGRVRRRNPRIGAARAGGM